jgi:NAD(P)-dependent dehydrogenase (short-subunit alcohol dehydrogenase family)
MGEFKGKVALVTGSGRGLGRACAQMFAREGASVVIVDVNRTNGEESVRLIRESGGAAVFVETNISISADVQRMVRAAEDTFGGLDFAINNAVYSLGGARLADIDEADWDRSFDVNVAGPFLCMKYEILAMLRRGGGAVVNVGSGNEFAAKPGMSWYLGAKVTTYGMGRCAAMEYAMKGIRINGVGPGSMWTPLMREQLEKNPKHLDRLLGYTPMRRIADPEEVAEAALWLCSSKASYVLGHTLLADGGAMLGPGTQPL